MNIALIVAAGSGTRMGKTDKPKQFIVVKDKPVLIYSLEAFNKNDLIDAIIVVTSAQYIDQIKKWCEEYKLIKVKDVILGGKTRQESVYNGLCSAEDISLNPNNDIVLIHDAARPLISQEIINSNVLACQKFDAVTTVVNASDTIVRSVNGDVIDDVPARNELFHSQTPQSFKLAHILLAHQEAIENGVENVTDDAQLMDLICLDVHLVKGDKHNFKITTADDSLMLEALLK